MTTMAELHGCVDELIKCPICLDDVDDPRSLPCLHTFCLKCLRSQYFKDVPGDTVECAMCRNPFAIPEKGLEQLPSNFFIGNLAAFRGLFRNLHKGVACEVCSDDHDAAAISASPATMYCTSCGQKLCDRCSKPHQKIPGGTHHVELIGKEPDEHVRKLMGRFCIDHSSNRLDLYCHTCKMNICVICHYGVHKEHQFEVVNNIYGEFSRAIENDIKLLSENELETVRTMNELDADHKQFMNSIEDTEKAVFKTAEEIKNCIDEAATKLQQELSVCKATAEKTYAVAKSKYDLVLSAYQSYTQYSQELIKRGKPCDITGAYETLRARAEDLLKPATFIVDDCRSTDIPPFKCDDVWGNMVEILFQKSSAHFSETGILRTLEKQLNEADEKLHDYKLQLKEHMLDNVQLLDAIASEHLLDRKQSLAQVARIATAANTARLIHTLTENKLIDSLAMLGNRLYVAFRHSKKIAIYGPDFDLIDYQAVHDMGEVSDMGACNRHKCVYMADRLNGTVHRLHNGAITEWNIGSDAKPSGLSVNSLFHVLVSCCDDNSIREFTTRGEFIRQIVPQSGALHPFHAVELSTDLFVVGHGTSADPADQRGVSILDAAGRVVKSYARQWFAYKLIEAPFRLAVHGFIFVADRYYNRVIMLSPDLDYVREIVSGLTGLSGMVFNERAGQLLVADKASTKTDGQVKVYAIR